MGFELPKFNLGEFIDKVENAVQKLDNHGDSKVGDGIDAFEKASLFNNPALSNLKQDLELALKSNIADKDVIKNTFGLQLSVSGELEQVEEPTPPVDDKQPEDCEPVKLKAEITEGKSYTPRTTRYTSWQDLANGYGLNDLDPKTQTRFAKVLQAIDLSKVPDDVDLKDIYNIDLIKDFAETTIKQGIEQALEKFPNLPIDKEVLKAVLVAQGGVDGLVKNPELYDSDGNKIEWIQPEHKTNVLLGAQGKTVKLPVTTKTIDEEVRYYKREHNSEDWIEIPKEEYDHLRYENEK